MPSHWLERAMNFPAGVIAKEVCRLWQSIRPCTVDCRSRLGSLAMTNNRCSFAGLAKNPNARPQACILLDPLAALRMPILGIDFQVFAQSLARAAIEGANSIRVPPGTAWTR